METEHMLCLLADILPQLEEIRLALKDMVPPGAARGEVHFETFHTFGGAVGGLRSARGAVTNLHAHETLAKGDI